MKPASGRCSRAPRPTRPAAVPWVDRRPPGGRRRRNLVAAASSRTGPTRSRSRSDEAPREIPAKPSRGCVGAKARNRPFADETMSAIPAAHRSSSSSRSPSSNSSRPRVLCSESTATSTSSRSRARMRTSGSCAVRSIAKRPSLVTSSSCARNGGVVRARSAVTNASGHRCWWRSYVAIERTLYDAVTGPTGLAIPSPARAHRRSRARGGPAVLAPSTP